VYGGDVRCGPVPALGATALATALVLASCATTRTADGRPTVVVTTSVLGAVVRDVVGPAAAVHVLMANGTDPHEWSPSAQDVEAVARASLVVENGLGLEATLQPAVDRARGSGVSVFVAGDHVPVRRIAAGDPADDEDHPAGAADPHLWLDASRMATVARALAPALAAVGIDVGGRGDAVALELDALDRRVAGLVAAIPAERRRVVTGHESLGYFADRYGLVLVGTLVPSLTSEAEPSAKDLAALVTRVRAEHVPAVFSEVGTPRSTVEALGRDAGVRVVPLTTHALPRDGTYGSLLLDLAGALVDALAPAPVR
jgi:zinc/manganese transport system substrate-binding protein